MVNAGKPPLGVGGVAGDEEEAGIFQRNEPPLGVQLRLSKTVAHGDGSLLREDGRAGIALFLGVVPVLTVPELSAPAYQAWHTREVKGLPALN